MHTTKRTANVKNYIGLNISDTDGQIVFSCVTLFLRDASDIMDESCILLKSFKSKRLYMKRFNISEETVAFLQHIILLNAKNDFTDRHVTYKKLNSADLSKSMLTILKQLY
jgi:hypothetical protein